MRTSGTSARVKTATTPGSAQRGIRASTPTEPGVRQRAAHDARMELARAGHVRDEAAAAADEGGVARRSALTLEPMPRVMPASAARPLQALAHEARQRARAGTRVRRAVASRGRIGRGRVRAASSIASSASRPPAQRSRPPRARIIGVALDRRRARCGRRSTAAVVTGDEDAPQMRVRSRRRERRTPRRLHGAARPAVRARRAPSAARPDRAPS